MAVAVREREKLSYDCIESGHRVKGGSRAGFIDVGEAVTSKSGLNPHKR